MRKLLRKKADPPQQPAPPPTVQKSPPLPPPLFARFASSHSTGSSPSPPVISGPAPLVPRDSVNRHSGPHDGSPPKPSSTRVVAPPVQRNRMYEKQQPVNGGRDDKPLPDPEQTPTQRAHPHTFQREPVQLFESRTLPANTNDQPPKPQKSIPEFRKRDNPPRNPEFAPVSLDTPSTLSKSGDMTHKLSHTPISASSERKPSSTRPAPTPELLPSGLSAFHKPPDLPQPRRKYSPLEAFGLAPGENSPVPSTTTSSVNLPSQNSQEPVGQSVLTTSSDSLPFLPGEAIPTTPGLDTTPTQNHDPRRESLPARTISLDVPPVIQRYEKLQRPQTADSLNGPQDLRMRADQLNRIRAHHPLGPRSSINRGPVQGQPRIFASMNTGTDFQQEPPALKQGQPRIFAGGNGQDSQPRSTNGPQPSSGYVHGSQPQQEFPTMYNSRTGDIKGKGVDRSGMDSMQGFQQPQQQPERPFHQRDNQSLPHAQMGETPIRTMYTQAKSPAMQYREDVEKGREWNRVGGNGAPDNKLAELPPTHRLPIRRTTDPHFEPPLPASLRKNSSGSSNEPQQGFMGPRGQLNDHQQAFNLDRENFKPSRRQSLYSPVVSVTANVPEPELSNELSIPSLKTVRSSGQRLDSAQREPDRYHPPPTPSFNTESSPPATNNYSNPDINGSSSEPPQSHDPRRQPIGWHVQGSTVSLPTQEPSRKISFTSYTSVSSDRERDRSPAVVEPQPVHNRPQKSTQPPRLDNSQISSPPAHHQSRERLRTSAAPENRGSQMDSFYGGDASLPGMKKLNIRNGGVDHTGIDEEPEPYFYPLELHLLHPQLLRALLQYLSFYDWCILQGVNKGLRSQLSHVKELKEEVLERHLSTIGYSRWVWEENEPLVISLRDLSEYMRGVSLPTHEYARISGDYLQARASTMPKEEKMRHTEQARAMSFATRAYSRIIVRLRAQAEAVMTHGGTIFKLPSGPVAVSRAHTRGMTSTNSSRTPSPSSHERQSSRPPNGQRGRMAFASPIYQPKRAPLLRVFVPSPEDWLSDASVVECEFELKRAGILHMLKPGDAVWDIAVGDEGNAGRMVWDGNFLLDLDYAYSTLGDLPRYLPSLAFAPSYFHRVIRINGNPVVHVDLNPWAEEIVMNLQLLQDKVKTETSQGIYHNVIRWVHRSTFQIYPPPNGKRIPFQFGSSTWHMDPGWYGTVVVEAEGTNEGLADLQSRCHSAFPARNDSKGQGSRDEERRRVFRILRERSKPGEIWIRTVGDKERLIP
ncbi:hypothetical protein BDM02DRAFT_3135101 [Thelephora ganbajun]|uniref:Uncharacterized protein n=1 Tax=Thelephora ganbajun TaxID=370292 RepID=A0ACB6ZWY1_THEGA|nr:hypothetical protein BDM02DRAFT_3135101 [Thelephora ganbajun]